MITEVKEYIKTWENRCYPELPDEAPKEIDDMVPSYKRIAMAIMRGDLKLIGVTPPKSEWYGILKRIELNERKINNMENDLDHIGDYDGYQVYRNKEGFLEDYKKTGKKMIHLPQGDVNLGTDCKRIVTAAKTMSEYIKQYERTRKPKLKIKPTDQPKLFDDTID